MAYTVNWTTKVFTVPLSDLTLVSGNNYTLDTSDFWIEVRRLEASAATGDGLWAEQALEFVNTQTLSGLEYSAIVKLINGYTWDIDSTNINVSLLGKNSNLLDTYIPGNGISVLANNSAGKIITGSGVTEQDKTDIISGVLAGDMTEDYPVDGQSIMTLTQAQYATVQLLTEFARTGAVVSVKKRDGSTEAIELTLDSATAPTTSTQSS